MAHTTSPLLETFDFTKTSAKAIASGDGWTLLHGDSLRILRELAEHGAQVDGLISDPPYSSGGQFRGDRNKSTSSKYRRGDVKSELVFEDFEGDNRDQRSFLAWASLWLWDAKTITRKGGIGFVFSDWRQLPVTTDAFQAGGWIWRGLFAWDKLGAERPAGHGRFSSRCEFGVWGSNGAMPYIPKQLEAEAAGFRGKQLAGTYGATSPRNRFHVTQKPVELLAYIANAVPVGGLILDPFSGSASTGCGALMGGRKFLGIELDVRAFEKSARRLETYAKQGADALLRERTIAKQGSLDACANCGGPTLGGTCLDCSTPETDSAESVDLDPEDSGLEG
jgi:site-specific DNA-methyltransferase (adenine-specific)